VTNIATMSSGSENPRSKRELAFLDGRRSVIADVATAVTPES
jgi:hypothetical protein